MRLLSFLSLFLSTSRALECNICGSGNRMTEQLGVVTLEYEGAQYKQNCEKWQDSLLISEEWCEQYMVEYTYDICKCVLPDGTLLKDSIVFPTASPAPTFADPLDNSPPGGDVQPVSLNTTNGGEGSSSWSRPRESVVFGMMAGLILTMV
ncbi:hypothetical protein FisN_26Hh085 [Fistulifera solaris]|uniref:Uncharacterized protein n=1 Tax=Fistulifera solaris TaxID=1519565 RepID=A0A1Z5JY27_FISSO|nr:hypothetical protein FisN_26Hh085 [Fistulifera solaris]|eukprot:GAX18786.1 hypothetical protein FisN_26Hh085 [Fistulifera solaris]